MAASQEWAESLQEIRKHEPAEADRIERAAGLMPKVGDVIGGFKLVGELGRGAFGRVFLANQSDLADRFVAVKITAAITGEPQKLAQLQHTNIVPVYSVHRADPLQAVVMPYLGSTTLAHLIGHLRTTQGPLPSSGSYILSTLNNHRTTDRSAAPSGGAGETVKPAALISAGQLPNPSVVLNMFRDMTYVQAMLWIASRIASGLAHAHERGILHRDLKPANILLTDEGQPMLLDFNLAEDIKVRRHFGRARMGGTLPYMAPEQLAVMQGESRSLDGRADLYAVGIILFELLTGRFPFPTVRATSEDYLREMLVHRRQPPPSTKHFNPNVTPAVDAIVARLLQPDPLRRYQKASALQEDLERQLADKPLQFAGEPSLRERCRKWRRRNPRLATGLAVAFAAGLFLVLPATAIAIRLKQSAEVRRRLERSDARELLNRTEADYREAHARLTSRGGDQKLLAAGLDAARGVFDRYGIGRNDAWEQTSRVASLSDAEQRRLHEMIGELLLLSARGEYLLSEDAKAKDAEDAANRLKTATSLNESAGRFFGAGEVSRSLSIQRADLLAAAGREQAARDLRAAALAAIAHSDYDRYVEAADLAASGKYREALARIEPVATRNPTHFAAWFVQGKCHDALNQLADAAECYSVCIALQPSSATAFLNRGIMRLRQGDHRRAEIDFTRAIELKPQAVDTWLNRAIARLNLNKLKEAETDLTESLRLSEAPTRVYFLRAMVRDRAGDKAAAASDRAEGMKQTPADSISWITRGFQRQKSDPQGALNDYEAALELNPRSRDALINKANVLSEDLRQPEAALKVFDRIIELWPEDLDAHGSRGVVLARLGRVAAARKDAEFCLQRTESAFVCFQMAGLYAQVAGHSRTAEDRKWALHLLAMTLRKGFNHLDWVASDPDLEPIRQEPEYRRLADLAHELATATK